MIKREVVSPLDFIGDVGGVFDGLCLVGSILIKAVSYFTGNLLEKFLLERVFKGSAADSVKDKAKTQESETIENLHNVASRKNFSLEKRFCHCLRSKREKQIIDKGW